MPIGPQTPVMMMVRSLLPVHLVFTLMCNGFDFPLLGNTLDSDGMPTPTQTVSLPHVTSVSPSDVVVPSVSLAVPSVSQPAVPPSKKSNGICCLL